MRSDNPEVIDRLASEYVLGTLRGPARRHFETWRARIPLVEERCSYWEEHLMHLAQGLAPVRPPARVWDGIRARLNFRAPRRSRFWPAAAAIAVSILLLIGLTVTWWRNAPPARVSAVAEIAAESGIPIWRVEVYPDASQLIVHAAKLPSKPAGYDYELWALPAGGAPVSLGVLPTSGASSRALSAMQKQALASSSKIAVSVEPPGGSPTGEPTGPVVFVAPLRSVS
jgi:anti-sigma-K factor RskA